MSNRSPFADPERKPPLEKRFLSLSPEELDFLKVQTLIESEDELKEHIFKVQKRAYDIYGYPCIRFFSFTKLKISRLPAYQSVLKLLHERSDAVFLDIGCCCFWDLGHELFKTTPTTYPAAFIAGDVFDSSLIAPRAPSTEVPQTPQPSLDTLVSLTPLQGRVSAIHASSFFHLFNETRQHELAHRLASLLSPRSGSVLFGVHIGKPDKGVVRGDAGEPSLFCHSPESWRDLWDGQVFEQGAVKVDAYLKQVERPDMKSPEPFYLLVWSVTRL
ncbi:hypothetical protein C0993_012723 [Termitomyces sp. T159_Od127]|nr:hypothetical protein C0993_012723 [Termitomyces sp. T159_Od127]